MTTAEASPLLRHSLRGNAVFSTLSGLGFAVGSGPVAEFLGGVPAALVLAVGVQLLLFAGALVWLSSRAVVALPLVNAVIVADLAWVAGTFAVIYAGLLSAAGAIAAVGVANIVFLFAMLQWMGVRKSVARKASA